MVAMTVVFARSEEEGPRWPGYHGGPDDADGRHDIPGMSPASMVLDLRLRSPLKLLSSHYRGYVYTQQSSWAQRHTEYINLRLCSRSKEQEMGLCEPRRDTHSAREHDIIRYTPAGVFRWEGLLPPLLSHRGRKWAVR